jgi:hypothetical protein
VETDPNITQRPLRHGYQSSRMDRVVLSLHPAHYTSSPSLSDVSVSLGPPSQLTKQARRRRGWCLAASRLSSPRRFYSHGGKVMPAMPARGCRGGMRNRGPKTPSIRVNCCQWRLTAAGCRRPAVTWAGTVSRPAPGRRGPRTLSPAGPARPPRPRAAPLAAQRTRVRHGAAACADTRTGGGGCVGVKAAAAGVPVPLGRRRPRPSVFPRRKRGWGRTSAAAR